MVEKIIISGFADEIDPQLDVQLKVVKELGMDHICLRAADGKVWLMPHNPHYEPIDGDHATILGKVTAVLRRL